jgi:hypothetical protein
MTDAVVFDIARLNKFLKSPNDVLIYHHSRGWDPGLELIRSLRCRRVIRYHNVTPPQFFDGYSRTDKELCERGRQELTQFAAWDVTFISRRLHSACGNWLPSAPTSQNRLSSAFSSNRSAVKNYCGSEND